MRLLDLFCGAGGAAMGYHRAGFDVVGVDVNPQPRYPFTFVQADAMTYPLDGFDVVHASPPCQDHSTLAAVTGGNGTGWMLPAVRERLVRSGVLYVIENVPGANMPGALTLCGSEFGLSTTSARHGEVWLRRHRLFESNAFLLGAGGCNCYGRKNVPVYGNGIAGNRTKLRGPGMAQAAREVMGIDWMRRTELDQAIPPAYTEFIGEQLLLMAVADA
jgi:DNA (cytosine-5)-methyltransferase 1